MVASMPSGKKRLLDEVLGSSVVLHALEGEPQERVAMPDVPKIGA
jgi:hypothetical protein